MRGRPMYARRVGWPRGPSGGLSCDFMTAPSAYEGVGGTAKNIFVGGRGARSASWLPQRAQAAHQVVELVR
eukprot:2687922-Pyramimonas_sp.AAC.1